MTRSGSQTRTSPFYVRTQEALQAKEYVEAAKQRDADSVGTRLKAAADEARKSAEEKGQRYLDSVSGTGGESEKVPGGRFNKEGKKAIQGVATVGGTAHDKVAGKEHETPEDHEVETEFNAILKKSPGTSIPAAFPHCC